MCNSSQVQIPAIERNLWTFPLPSCKSLMAGGMISKPLQRF